MRCCCWRAAAALPSRLTSPTSHHATCLMWTRPRTPGWPCHMPTCLSPEKEAEMLKRDSCGLVRARFARAQLRLRCIAGVGGGG